MKNHFVFCVWTEYKEEKAKGQENCLRKGRLAAGAFLYYLCGMESWRLNYRRGLRRLERHDPAAALRFLRDAVQGCPVRRTTDLAEILFYAGIAMKKIGLHDAAIQTWSASRRIWRGGPAQRHLRRFSNEYGMAKQGLAELDDWRAFYSLQISRYLRSKRSRSIGTLAEGDMIRDLISDAWGELKESRILEGKTVEQKMAIFRAVSIVFPYFYVPGLPGAGSRSAGFPGDSQAASCSCGSGLPFHRCCGRDEKPFGAGTGLL